MYFGTKNYLKSNHYYPGKHHLNCLDSRLTFNQSDFKILTLFIYAVVTIFFKNKLYIFKVNF
jgi:hypothetical protein